MTANETIKMSIISQAKDLENFSDQMLQQLGQQPDGRYAPYLVLFEVERRTNLEKRYANEKAKADAANPPPIAEQRFMGLGGIASLDPSMGGGQPSQGMPDPGMGQMGGPPPGMDQMQGMGGPPPMMAYGGGLIPGYQNGGTYPNPDQDLYSQNLPGTDDYEREGLFGSVIDFTQDQMSAAAARRREFDEKRRRFLGYVPLEERTPEYEREREEFLRETAMGMVGSTGNVVKKGASAAIPFARNTAGRVRSALRSRREQLIELAKARKLAKANDAAAAQNALDDAVTAATGATPGRARRAADIATSVPRALLRNPGRTGLGAGAASLFFGDSPEESGSGLETIFRKGASGIGQTLVRGRDFYEDMVPDFMDLPGGEQRRIEAGGLRGGARRAAERDREAAAAAGYTTGPPTERTVSRAELDAAVSRGQGPGAGLAQLSTALTADYDKERDRIRDATTKMQVRTQAETDLSTLRREEAERETALLKRQLGLDDERIAELMGGRRTGEETDRLRKANLLSKLGSALMGNPRNLGAGLERTTSGILDLDESLRSERRADDEAIYGQRSVLLDAERSGMRNIASLKGSELEALAATLRLGEEDRDRDLSSLGMQELAGMDRLEQLRLSLSRARETQSTGGRLSAADYDELENIAVDAINDIVGDTDERMWTDEQRAAVDEVLDSIQSVRIGSLREQAARYAATPGGG